MGLIDDNAAIVGAAVQSHAFSAGGVVPWGRPGVGVVLTQGLVNREWGPQGLRLLERGQTAEDAPADLVAADGDAAHRQGAVLSVDGTVACHTGGRCIPEAGHITTGGFSVQANTMEREGVPLAMAEALVATENETPERRLLAALWAAQRAGGDIRGMRSAVILLVSMRSGLPVEQAYPLDLRVEDHPTPLKELERLVNLAPDVVEIRFRALLARAAVAAPEEFGALREELDSLDRPDGTIRRWYALARRLPSTRVVELSSDRWDRLLAPRAGRIYHLCEEEQWRALNGECSYRDPSLDAEGLSIVPITISSQGLNSGISPDGRVFPFSKSTGRNWIARYVMRTFRAGASSFLTFTAKFLPPPSWRSTGICKPFGKNIRLYI